MNFYTYLFLIGNAIGMLFLPRSWASLPLLIGACYMTLGQGVEIGPFSFTVIRMLVVVGIIRVTVRGERLANGLISLDWYLMVWALLMVLSGLFHEDPSSALVYRLGAVFNACGIYFLIRIFCQSYDDVIRLCIFTAIILFPVAIEMMYEKLTVNNMFSILGGIPSTPAIRVGKIRAQGPFAHAILAGTVGAVSLPIVIGIWSISRRKAIIGIVACVIMIFSSSSSGPLMSGLMALGAMYMWRFRKYMRLFRWTAFLGYLGLDLVMKAPAYYLLGRVDLTGGSTGWHRARLIEASLIHLNEWWFAGTDYTRHWMPTGVHWSEKHTDITNHYLSQGIFGGLPVLLLFIAILVKGFSAVGVLMQDDSGLDSKLKFLIWGLGGSLFVHTASMIGISYFDQSVIFLYTTLASIGSLSSYRIRTQNEA
jgi:hypothetical protein